MTTTRVYPVPGRVVRHPETNEPVPAAGLEVPRAGYWLRRIMDGDLTEHAPAAPAKKKKEEALNADNV
ncbi:MAG: DUF2635 domain-containing protein [Desulfovibrio sp.]|jgi:hypothetical protein|nr:DUF2635 domain-containing protein [Desulfovibrio sp.]